MASNIHYLIRKVIYDYLLAGVTFAAAIAQVVGGTTYTKLFYHLAPEYVDPNNTAAPTLPYVVMSLLPIGNWFDSVTTVYTGIVQFNVAASSLTAAEALAQKLDERLANSEAGLNGNALNLTFIEVIRKPLEYLGEIEKVHNFVLQYSFQVQIL